MKHNNIVHRESIVTIIIIIIVVRVCVRLTCLVIFPHPSVSDRVY